MTSQFSKVFLSRLATTQLPNNLQVPSATGGGPSQQSRSPVLNHPVTAPFLSSQKRGLSSYMMRPGPSHKISRKVNDFQNRIHLPLRSMSNFAKNFYQIHPVDFVKGDGVKLIDANGKEYYDAHSAYGVTLFGHSLGELYKPVLDKIMANQMPMTHGAFPKKDTEIVAKTIAYKTAACLGGAPEDWQVYFNNTGAEAVETGLKFARKWGSEEKKLNDENKLIFGVKGCFHGRALGGTSLFDGKKKNYQDGFGPLLPGIHHIELNNLEGLKALEKKGATTAAIMLEPIQGEGGINVPSAEWIKELSAICQRQNILIVADEVQSGLHRTGPFWASAHFRHLGFSPDILLSAKALGGGLYPVGAVVMKRNIADLLKPGMHGSTFGGNIIAMGAVARTLALIDTLHIEKNVSAQSDLLDTLLAELKKKYPDNVKEITGAGLWRGIRFDETLSTHRVAETMLKNGLITGESGSKVLRFAPALNVSAEELKKMVELLDKSFEEISRPDFA